MKEKTFIMTANSKFRRVVMFCRQDGVTNFMHTFKHFSTKVKKKTHSEAKSGMLSLVSIPFIP